MDRNNIRIQITAKGQVQGVGFRPYVYRLATSLNLTGLVYNHCDGVSIEVQGASSKQFLSMLQVDLPPLAHITDLQSTLIPLIPEESSFEISSSLQGKASTSITPDTCICKECLAELFDPHSRYYHYPFLNCTNCGPRFSIVHQLPYDRCHTAMNAFTLCPQCQQEYTSPSQRRYHAQPTACSQCGPMLSMSVEAIGQRIQQGEIIAIKGLGGYQLICDARQEDAIQRLRCRKNRDAKPFAVMVLNIQSARQWVEMTAHEAACLNSPERPIVLLPKKGGDLPDIIAPFLSSLGVMLPSTPLHYLLFHALAGFPEGRAWLDDLQSTILVVTSANPAHSPLVIDDQDAQTSLKMMADTLVDYSRRIVSHVDDSVVRMIQDAPMLIRRARGYVPKSIKLARAIPSTLALGAHLKHTFCITRGDEAFVSQYIGSLHNKVTIDRFHEVLNHVLHVLNVTPERIAHDLHPDFYTTQLATDFDLPAFAIQHHHAHLAAVAAEYRHEEPILGLALDGYGYGIEGQAWGGELMRLEGASFTHLGSLYPIPQPGADKAAREIWRMAAGVMHCLGRGGEIADRYAAYPDASFLSQLLEKQLFCSPTSSCGRLFDAASAILGVRLVSQYESQAAMQLESLVTVPQVLKQGWRFNAQYLDFLPVLAALFDTDDPVYGANVFHGTLIAGFADWIHIQAQANGIHKVLLSGGCFLNRILTEGLVSALHQFGIQVFLPRLVPPNDGGISLGQAWIAGQNE